MKMKTGKRKAYVISDSHGSNEVLPSKKRDGSGEVDRDDPQQWCRGAIRVHHALQLFRRRSEVEVELRIRNEGRHGGGGDRGGGRGAVV